VKKKHTKKKTKKRPVKPAARQVPPPPIAMRSLITGYWISQAVYAAARLGIADLVANGPKAAADLAKATGTRPEPLARLLRALASLGVFRETKDGVFARTALSDTLRTGVPQSMKSLALMTCRGYNWLPWANLTEGITNGGVPFDELHGMKFFEYLEGHADDLKVFGEAMTSVSGVENPAVAKAYDFSRFRTLVDVGGSHGHMLAEILREHRKLRGILFDQPSVIARAREAGHVTAKEVASRLAFSSGSFFEDVPAGADGYVMKYILHDWTDDLCVEILSNCRAAMAPGGRVLVVDSVIAPGNNPSWGKLLDLNMLVVTGGKERTAKEFAELFARAGLALKKIHPTECDLSIVEAVAT
jgi:hypothetical protein